MPRAYSVERSRATTPIPGRRRSQSASVSAVRSGSSSSARRRSRSTTMVPQVRPLRTARSSTPTTRGGSGSGGGRPRTRRSSAAALVAMARCRGRRAPASPPSATPTRPWASASLRVRRARGPSREALGEGAAGAGRVAAVEPAHAQLDPDRPSERGQVGRATAVAAVDGPARPAAIRAAAAGSRAARGDVEEPRAVRRDPLDAAARHGAEFVHAPSYGAPPAVPQHQRPPARSTQSAGEPGRPEHGNGFRRGLIRHSA
jgi:hypothetical protein